MTAKKTLKVLLTGAAGQIGYSIIYMIANGDAFGPDYMVHIVMLDLPVCENVMLGVKFEIEDCAFPLVAAIDVCTDAETAFKDIDAAVLVAGAMALKEGMKRSELLVANRKIYEEQGQLLDRLAKPTTKVIVVANPANTNCYILTHTCKKIPAKNFSCLTRLDHNRAKAMLARKLDTNPSNVYNAIVWGNHSSSMVPDCSKAMLKTDSKDAGKKIFELINDEKWNKDVFVPEVKERAAKIIKYRQRSSALSAAKATCDHLRDWFNGTRPGDYVSMGVLSDGSYGMPKDIIFGFPCVCANGEYKIVSDLQLSEETKKEMLASANELLEEKKMSLE